MARFPAQPSGPGPFCRDAAFLAGSFSPLNVAARALPRGKTGSGAAVRETSTDPAPTPPLHSVAPAAARGKGERILLVEDDKVVRMLVVEALEELGYQLIQAGDAQSALSLLEQHAPLDLLLTDVGLPGMNGRQLADAARHRQPGLRVLFSSGHVEAAVAGDAVSGDGTQMIAKPFSFEALAATIRALLDA
ncbi:Response regulator receiver domain-containing protein [Pseudomonas flavescens]|uniref:Response regulator receiver domain-containing protein n=1 Tax=Phytopseudomonas flavescens TaxID=29435 RepID=A0A1G8JU03_9GAMM|nr:Response regulator receiver domain-containing protein [Pseudomonas flavescens]